MGEIVSPLILKRWKAKIVILQDKTRIEETRGPYGVPTPALGREKLGRCDLEELAYLLPSLAEHTQHLPHADASLRVVTERVSLKDVYIQLERLIFENRGGKNLPGD